MSALFLSTDTLDKPLEGYAAHRKTPPSTDSLTQRSYLTHNKTTATPNGTAAATVVRRKAPHASQSQSIRREARSAKRAAGTDPIQNARSAPLFPQQVIHRRPDIAGPAISLLLGMSEDVPKSKLMAGPDDYRAIDYPVFCKPAETPVTVERIRLMYSAFFSSAISSWFIRTSRRARTWAMDRAST